MEKYGGNVAGIFWNAGTALQFVLGMVALAPLEIVSSVFNVMAPCCYLFFGHRNWGVALGGILGIVGGTLAIYPGLITLEAGTLFGFVTMCVFISMSIFSAPLTRRFGQAKNSFLRTTLGHPRRLDGYGSVILSRLPIIYESIAHHRWRLVAVFAIWALGDIALSFSRADARPA